jgi:ferric-dicitrate binding protein FerR (iron transport regulator)
MTEPEFRALLERYLSGKASAEEQRLLDQFFDSYRDQHTDLPGMSEPVKEEILQNIRQRTDLGIKIVSARRSYAWMAAAASVALLAVAGYFFFTTNAPRSAPAASLAIKTLTLTTTRGQRTSVTLADGTQVRLNANSTLSYPERFMGDTREVRLEGEGYFDVTSDVAHPFIVHSGHTATRVLGTSFNVRAIPASVTVTLVEGKVNIAAGGATHTLQPNQQAVVHAGSAEIATHAVDVSKYISWTNNTLIFDRITVGEALAQMENWYNVDIDADPAVASCLITARYENESLENILNSLHFMLHIDFAIEGHRVQIRGKGCK